MFDAFEPIIYRETDEAKRKRGVWVRISPSAWGVSIATFRSKPTKDTPEWKSMTSLHFDPCFMNQSKIVAWKEGEDPENSDGIEVPLIESIDAWRPRPVGEEVSL